MNQNIFGYDKSYEVIAAKSLVGQMSYGDIYINTDNFPNEIVFEIDSNLLNSYSLTLKYDDFDSFMSNIRKDMRDLVVDFKSDYSKQILLQEIDKEEFSIDRVSCLANSLEEVCSNLEMIDEFFGDFNSRFNSPEIEYIPDSVELGYCTDSVSLNEKSEIRLEVSLYYKDYTDKDYVIDAVLDYNPITSNYNLIVPDEYSDLINSMEEEYLISSVVEQLMEFHLDSILQELQENGTPFTEAGLSLDTKLIAAERNANSYNNSIEEAFGLDNTIDGYRSNVPFVW